MKRILLSVCLAGACATGFAQNLFTAAVTPAAPLFSSSAAAADPLPEAPMFGGTSRAATQSAGIVPVMPFSAIGFAVKAGTGGIGLDIATPLVRKINIRSGISFFNYNRVSSSQDVNYNGTLKLGMATAGIDIFPWAGAFHLTPGVVYKNRTNASAILSVPAGKSITLNDQDYTSSATHPIRGTAALTMDHSIAPSFTMGWGNIIPRKGGHWSIPVEFGAMMTNRPKISLTMAGTACSKDGCQDVSTDPETQANLAAEQTKLNNDLEPLRFYPMVSIGFSYSFGRRGSGVR